MSVVKFPPRSLQRTPSQPVHPGPAGCGRGTQLHLQRKAVLHDGRRGEGIKIAQILSIWARRVGLVAWALASRSCIAQWCFVRQRCDLYRDMLNEGFLSTAAPIAVDFVLLVEIAMAVNVAHRRLARTHWAFSATRLVSIRHRAAEFAYKLRLTPAPIPSSTATR